MNEARDVIHHPRSLCRRRSSCVADLRTRYLIEVASHDDPLLAATFDLVSPVVLLTDRRVAPTGYALPPSSPRLIYPPISSPEAVSPHTIAAAPTAISTHHHHNLLRGGHHGNFDILTERLQQGGFSYQRGDLDREVQAG
jgi:hypothetical protein